MLLKSKTKKIKLLNLNFGPQHPAAHGVLRLILELSGERVLNCNPHIGLLHRGTEKLIEQKTYLQGLGYLDRTDYVSTLSQEHCYILTIESLLETIIPKRSQLIRVLFSEITRILNHIMSVTTHALDVGALSPLLWVFEEREKLMEFYERVSGSRLHSLFFRPGGIAKDLPVGLIGDIFLFCKHFDSRINELEELLTKNRVWQGRLQNVGIVSKNSALNWGFSGVLLRSTGIRWDLRKAFKYENYSSYNFKIPYSSSGDSYDRYLLRIEEMRQSTSIILQAINNLNIGKIKYENYKYITPSRFLFKNNMEVLISHYKLYSYGFFIKKNENYISIEAPKGELGCFIVSNNNNKAYRCKIRAPGFFHLQGLNYIAKGLFLADVVTIIGTIDIVFGEIDR